MIGKEYKKYPELLFDSFKNMAGGYSIEKQKKGFSKKLKFFLMKKYLSLFGIPEIGTQLRFLHFESVLKSISKFEPNSILDAGCGMGIYSFWLSKKFPKSNITGFDIDRDKLFFGNKLTRELGINNVKFIYRSIENIKDRKNKFDLIVNIDVLEHLKDQARVLQNFHNLLSPDGYLYIHVPCSKTRRILKVFLKDYYRGHIQDGFTLDQLEKKMKETGFKIIKRQKTFGFLGLLLWELNHIALSKNLFLAGLTFPFLNALCKIDLGEKRDYYSFGILAKKDKE